MLSAITRRWPSAPLVLSALALFVSLGGVGYAAATIGSAQIKNNSIQSKDIQNKTIAATDVKDNAIDGSKIAESQVGKVPNATRPTRTGPGRRWGVRHE